MIDIKNKVLFIHIPRTGGSEFCNQYYNLILRDHIDYDFYRDYLVGNDTASKHFTYKECAQFYHFTNLAEFNLVSIFRNIYELVVSTYFQLLQPGKETHGFYDFAKRTRYGGIEKPQQDPLLFSTWVDYLVRSAEFWKSKGRPRGLEAKTPYVSMLQAEFLDGNHADCYLIPYEEFNTGVNEWFSMIFDIDTDIKAYDDKSLKRYYDESKYFIPRPMNYRDVYDDRTLCQIRDLFEDDINMFDFKI